MHSLVGKARRQTGWWPERLTVLSESIWNLGYLFLFEGTGGGGCRSKKKTVRVKSGVIIMRPGPQRRLGKEESRFHVKKLPLEKSKKDNNSFERSTKLEYMLRHLLF